tara:strand:- start:600 stop:2105 length:1506 start_codon:yes stop_codon:yes gene_type:complete
MDTNDLRKKALKAIDDTNFFPQQGQNRLRTMIADRPDWCVSRQRVWGVPLPIFVNKKSGEPLRDPIIIERIAKIYELEGGDAWFNSKPSRFLSPEYNEVDFEQVKDVVEVWFDSGSTHAYVLEDRDDLESPATMYLEGSDQFRGFFHSSLLESCGTRGRAPFKTVLSHGFVVDGKGRKMSKSIGNVISPDEIINKYGADILRIWVIASDYSEDIRLDNTILNYQIDSYRKVRNTFRFLLGNLNNFDIDQIVEVSEMPELERYMFSRLSKMHSELKNCMLVHDYHSIYVKLLNFCTLELSAFYFDIRKDSLYCDPQDSLKRKSAVTCLHFIFEFLAKWFSPILSFTTEEAWELRLYNNNKSIHLQTFNEDDYAYYDEKLEKKWIDIREIRKAVTSALEIKRNEKLIGSSLQAQVVIFLESEILNNVKNIDLSELSIVSNFKIKEMDEKNSSALSFDDPRVFVDVEIAPGLKCQRCWTVKEEVRNNSLQMCDRCDNVWKSVSK